MTQAGCINRINSGRTDQVVLIGFSLSHGAVSWRSGTGMTSQARLVLVTIIPFIR
jgi:hypothetical protein